MKNNSEKISASEVNRYCFCPYQWYYERVYGKSNLINLKKEELNKLGIKDFSKSNLKRGVKFHNNYLKIYKIKQTIKFLFYMLIFVFFLLIILKYV